MFGWLNKKAEQSQAYEAERFLVSLKGGDVHVVDAIMGTTIFWAAIYKAKSIDLYDMESWIIANPLFPIELNKLIRVQQKQGTQSAATGLMVWLFSARSLLYPEQRLSGRNIWEQLGRASLFSEKIAFESCAAMGLQEPSIDYLRVPYGLEKLEV
jgi:hypothetical protein